MNTRAILATRIPVTIYSNINITEEVLSDSGEQLVSALPVCLISQYRNFILGIIALDWSAAFLSKNCNFLHS